MKYHLHSPIVEIERLAPDILRFVLDAPEVAAGCRPGQFVNAKVADEDFPLLRRPLSIHDSDGASRIELVFRIVGEGTRILAGRRTGERLDIIGPLGTPFKIDAQRKALLVGGGVGIPPVHYLCRELRRRGIPNIAFVGLRTKAELGLAGKLPEMADRCLIATEDGSLGTRGFVTELLEAPLTAGAPAAAGGALYACGPPPMLKRVITLAKESGLPAQVAFEQQMACAFGACIGCSIETNSGYQRVCTEGPVFDARLFY